MLWVCGQPLCRGAVGRGWGGNVCCGFVVKPHIPVVVGDGQQLQLQVCLHAEGSLPAAPLRSQIIVTLLKSHCVPW